MKLTLPSWKWLCAVGLHAWEPTMYKPPWVHMMFSGWRCPRCKRVEYTIPMEQ